MRVDDGFVLREIAGDYVQEETTFENIVKGILDEYDADEETVKADVQEFLDRIKEAGILK